MRPGSAFIGGMFAVGTRWVDRILGLGSTLVLARLLTPADFGLVAMATVAVGLIEIALDLGTSAALVQKQAPDRADFDTAWTLRLLQSVTVALIVALIAPLVGQYYGDTRIPGVMWVIALSIIAGGLENIGVVNFQKDMQFNRELHLLVAKRMIGVFVTVVVAIALRSYWALLIGTLATRLAGVVLGYWMHPFRPRLSLSRSGAIWSFSKWNILLSTSAYLLSRSDKLVVGGRTSPSTMGAYTIADELASLPTTELLAPLGRVMFPAFVRAIGESNELKRLVKLSLSIQALLGIPAGVGLALVADEAVPLLLGPKWMEAIPFLQLLCASAVIWAMASSSHYLLLALGRVKTLALANISLLTLFLLSLVLGKNLSAAEIASVRVLFAALSFLVLAALSMRHSGVVGAGDFAAAAWRPTIGAGVMASILISFAPALAGQGGFAELALQIGVGATVYLISVLVLWLASGSPVGGESYLLDQIRSRIPQKSTGAD
jgi:O-antigen/teichoic acid export membrane protein